MDGIALRWQAPLRQWQHQACQLAGDRPLQLKHPDFAIEVATGTVRPTGTDTVIPYEQLDRQSGLWVLKTGVNPIPGQHIQGQGSEHRRGQLLLTAPTLLRAPELGLLAALGQARVQVSAAPRIALISNGSELVDVEAAALPHQLHECNSYAARGCLYDFAFQQVQTFLVRDREDELREAIEAALSESDIVVLSGGISRGPKDLARDVLKAIGVREIFYEIAQRPGRPFWFGQAPGGTPVLGLPGNPVAALINLRLYLVPALCKMEGRPLRAGTLKLAATQKAAPEMERHLPCQMEEDALGGRWAHLPEPRGSGDIASLSATDGFVSLPAREHDYHAGESVTFYAWNS